MPTPDELRVIDRRIAEEVMGWRDIGWPSETIICRVTGIDPTLKSEARSAIYSPIPRYTSDGNDMLALWAELEKQGLTVMYGKKDDGSPYFSIWQMYPDGHAIYEGADLIDGNKALALAQAVILMIDAKEKTDGI